MIDSSLPNPFLASVVTDPWKPAQVDVAEIHAEAFGRCCQAIEYVRKTSQSTSIIIHGEAGSGKTHLMARLRSYLSRVPAVFISVPLQTSPQMLWRHLRRCLVDDVLRPVENDQTQFIRIASQRAGSTAFQSESWLSQVQMDYDLSCVLSHLLTNRYRRESRAWLRGDSLSETDLTNLGLPAIAEDEEDPEDKSRRVTLSLCKLCGSAIPLIICFDQVEALQNRPGEKTGLSAFGRMVQSLHDGTENVLVISCLQSSYLDPLFDAVDNANQDRLASSGKLALLPLIYDQAVSLISARLRAVPELADLSRGRPRLWPLNESDIKAFFEHETVPRVVARKIIAHCAQLFETARERPKKTTIKTRDYLEQLWQVRLESAATYNLPEDSDQILQHGLLELMGLGEVRWQENQEYTLQDIDLIFSRPGGNRIEISLCNQQNMTSLATRLKRLIEDQKKGKFQQLVLIRDPRRPVKPTAKKTNEYLHGLKELGVHMIHPPVEVLAALDALRSLLSEAKAGDLAHGGRTIEPDTLRKWLAENIPASLQDFMEDMATKGEDDFPEETLLALLEEHPLVTLSEAAAQIKQPPQSLEVWVRRHPGLVGFLNGPPGLLFQIVPDTLSWDFQEGPA